MEIHLFDGFSRMTQEEINLERKTIQKYAKELINDPERAERFFNKVLNYETDNITKRYDIVEHSDGSGDLIMDVRVSPDGQFVKYEDYEKGIEDVDFKRCPSNTDHPKLNDVLAEIEEKEISGGALVRVKDVKEILSKYFA